MYKKLCITYLHIIVFVFIHMFSFTRLMKLIQNVGSSSRIEYTDQEICRLAKYYGRIIHFSQFKYPSCLEHALMLAFFLKRKNIVTEFCLGIARLEGKLTAHAWLTCKGVVLGKQFDVDTFTKIFSSTKIAQVEVRR